MLATGESDKRGETNVLGGSERLAEVGARAGAADLPDEKPGVLRRYEHSVGRLPTIATVVAARAGRAVGPDRFDEDGAWIDYRGGPGTIKTVSYVDVLKGRVPAPTFRGKMVVVGASVPTLQDVHPTPTADDALMSGAEVQANAIWTALHGNPLRDGPPPLGALTVLFLSCAVPLLAVRLSIIKAALAGVTLASVYLVSVQLAFEGGVVLQVVYPLASLALATVMAIVARYYTESRERRFVARLNEVLEKKVMERTEELREAQLEVIQRLGRAVDSRDQETGGHIERIGELCHTLGMAAGMSAHEG